MSSPATSTRPRPRSWTFDYLAACELVGDQVVELGDELALRWRGPLARPELAPRGEEGARRAIVVRINRDDNGRGRGVVLALVAEGVDFGRPAAAA